MFDPMEYAVSYVHNTLNIPASTYLQEGVRPQTTPVCAIVQRTGGEISYPHDNPDFAVQILADSDEKAQLYAYSLAVALKTQPPKDKHLNAVGTPTIYSYGMTEDGDWFVWQVTIPMAFNLVD